MENVISRFRNTANLIVLAAVLVLQIIGLAVQVQRASESGSTRLIRVWAISVVTPLTKAVVHTQDWFSDTWHNYVWLRGVRKENEALQNEIVQMKMREVRMVEDANQARRLQLLLGFKEKYISQTVPAQVISTTGSEFSRAIYIDKGTRDGIAPDMPVVTPEGVVGKVLHTYQTTSLVLLINDPTSGAGVILEKSRLQAILKGDVRATGTLMLSNVMSDEKVEVGERILTSGGDKIFPKGMVVGTVAAVAPGQDIFLNIRVRPATSLSKLEEVLIITKMDERTPDAVADAKAPVRAIDILAERLPTVAPPAPSGEGASKTSTSVASGTAKPGDQKTTPALELKPASKTGISQQASKAVEPVKPVKQAQTTPAIKETPRQ
jgi:rod shape-determining protein MreC